MGNFDGLILTKKFMYVAQTKIRKWMDVHRKKIFLDTPRF